MMTDHDEAVKEVRGEKRRKEFPERVVVTGRTVAQYPFTRKQQWGGICTLVGWTCQGMPVVPGRKEAACFVTFFQSQWGKKL